MMIDAIQDPRGLWHAYLGHEEVAVANTRDLALGLAQRIADENSRDAAVEHVATWLARVKCPDCRGSGWCLVCPPPRHECGSCGGDGRIGRAVPQRESAEVIPFERLASTRRVQR